VTADSKSAVLDITTELAGLTDRLVAFRAVRNFEGIRNMDRLTEKLARAGGAVGRVTERIERRADSVIAREEKLNGRTDQIFDAHDAILDSADTGLDGVEQKLALVSNDPLQVSKGS
jgi:hypothetical protein